MQAEAFGWSWVEWMIALLAAGAPGLPPGERDPQLVRVIPADAVVAVEWASRSKERLPSPGFPAFVAEPEVRAATDGALRWWSMKVAPAAEQMGPSWAVVRDQLPLILATAGHHPGCFYLDQNGTSVLILSTGEATAATAQELRRVVPAWLMRETEPLIPNAFTHFLRTDRALIWSFGKDLRASIANRFLQPQPGLADLPEYQQALTLLPHQSPAHLAWCRLTKLPAGLPTSGLTALAITSVEAGALVHRGVALAPIDPAALLAGPPAIETAKLIPADAQFAASTTIGLESLVTNLTALAKTRGIELPRNPQAVVADWGLHWEEDVVPAFGSTWTAYSAGSTGGAFGLYPVISLDVRQPRQAYVAFTQAMERLQGWAKNDPQGRWLLRDTLDFDRVIYTLHDRSGAAGYLAPSACLTDQQLLIALNPQTLRSHLRFLARGGPSLAERPDFAPVQPANAWVFSEPRPALEAVWPLLTTSLYRAAVRPDLQQAGIDGSLWPSLGSVLPYVRPMQASITRDAQAWKWEVRHPLSGIAPIAAGLALWQSTQQRPTNLSPTGPETDLGPSVELGPVEGAAVTVPSATVVPAVAIEAQPAPPVQRRPWLSGLVRGFIPDDVEAAIPAEVFRKLEEGPTAAEQAARAERAAQRKAARERNKSGK